MDLPKPKNLKEAKDQIELLQKELRKYDDQRSLAKFYLSIKTQMDKISELLFNAKLDEDTLMDKDDRVIDRSLKFMEKGKSISEGLTFMKEKLNPEVVDSIEKEDGSYFEKLLDEMSNG